MISNISKLVFASALLIGLGLCACDTPGAQSTTITNAKGSADVSIDTDSYPTVGVIGPDGKPVDLSDPADQQQIENQQGNTTDSLTDPNSPYHFAKYTITTVTDVYITYRDNSGNIITSEDYIPPQPSDPSSSQFKTRLQGVVDDFFNHYTPRRHGCEE